MPLLWCVLNSLPATRSQPLHVVKKKKKTHSFIHLFSSHERDPPYICSVLAEAVPVILNVFAYLDDTPTADDAHAEGTQSRFTVLEQLLLLHFVQKRHMEDSSLNLYGQVLRI